MPILPSVGKKSPQMRLLIIVMYTILITGSITMAYPFLIMISGSVKGNADIGTLDAVPKVLYSDKVRFARFLEERYGSLTVLSAAHSRGLIGDEEATVPEVSDTELNRFQRFLKDESANFPDHFFLVQEIRTELKVRPRNFRLFRSELQRECGNIEEFTSKYNCAFSTWNDFSGVLDTPLTKEFWYDQSALVNRYLEFKRSRPFSEKAMLNIDGHYFNMQNGFPMVTSGEMEPAPILTSRCPKGPEKALWTEFVKHTLNCLFVRLDDAGLALFRKDLKQRFPSGVAQMNKINATTYTSFDSVRAAYGEFRNSGMFSLYTDFVTNVCPPEHLIVDTHVSQSTRNRNP